MKRQLRSKYGFLIVIGMVLLLFAYTSTWAKNDKGDDTIDVPLVGEVSRTISPTKGIQGSEFVLTYTFSLEKILDKVKGPNMNSYKYVEWEAEIKETIPNGFKVPNTLPEGFTFNDKTRELSAQLTFICGKKNSGAEETCKSYTKDEINPKMTIQLIGEEPGKYTFETGKYKYSFYADHAGNGSTKHDRTYNNNPGSLPSQEVVVEAMSIKIPTNVELYIKDAQTISVTVTPENIAIPENTKLTWEIDGAEIVGLKNAQNNRVTLEAIKVGNTKIRAVYEFANGFKVKSNDLNVDVKLPKLSLATDKQELWVYQNETGTVVKQQALITLAQVTDQNQSVKNPLNVTWNVDSTALKLLSSQNTSATVQAEHGSTSNISVVAKLKDYIGQTMPVLINVKEYPQKVSTPNVILYMTDSPYSYPVKFWPETANVTGYGLTVLEGTDVMTAKDGVLTLLKPGIAKIGLVTEDVSASFKAGGGPKVISQTFYVRVKAGTDPNPGTEDPSGDFY